MPAPKHLSDHDLAGKVIDAHAHVGFSLKGYVNVEFPYGQTLEGLYYRQLANEVDVNIVFPLSADLFFDPASVARGHLVPAAQPLSPAPYAVENEVVMAEVFRFCPELRHRFLPFVSVDPGRAVDAQMRALAKLEESYPVYGIKIVPVGCQSQALALLEGGGAFLDFAEARDLPLLFHTTVDPRETFSHARDLFQIIARRPKLRFCLAHCIGFSRKYLELADAADNVWVDSAAMKIQVQLAHENSTIMAPPGERFDADYADHTKVMRALCERYPETMIWGSDSPAYAYICRREQAPGVFAEFRLKATYEDEKVALDALPEDLRMRAANLNTRRWLFGAATVILGHDSQNSQASRLFS